MKRKYELILDPCEVQKAPPVHENFLSVAAVPGLRAPAFIRGLQEEAQRALGEVVHLLHPGDASRLSRVLLAASSIQSVSHELVSQLFLKPVFKDTETFLL